MSGQDKYTNWDAGKDGKDYKQPTAQQADEIRRILKKNKGKLKGKGGIPLAQRKTNDVNTYG